MKKNPRMWHGVLRTPRSKLFLMMKLTFFFLMLGLLEVHASVKAQVKTVNLDVRNMPLKEVFGELKKQTELDFFFSNEELDMNSRVTIQVEKADLMDVLARILGRSRDNQGDGYYQAGNRDRFSSSQVYHVKGIRAGCEKATFAGCHDSTIRDIRGGSYGCERVVCGKTACTER